MSDMVIAAKGDHSTFKVHKELFRRSNPTHASCPGDVNLCLERKEHLSPHKVIVTNIDAFREALYNLLSAYSSVASALCYDGGGKWYAEISYNSYVDTVEFEPAYTDLYTILRVCRSVVETLGKKKTRRL